MFHITPMLRLVLPAILTAAIAFGSLLLSTVANAGTLAIKHGQVFSKADLLNAPEQCEELYLTPLRRTIGKEFTIQQTCHDGLCKTTPDEHNTSAETRQKVYWVHFSGDLVRVTGAEPRYAMLVNYELVAENNRPIYANVTPPGKLLELIEQERENIAFSIQVDCVRAIEVKTLHSIFTFEDDVCPNSEPVFHPNPSGITLMRLRNPPAGQHQYLSVKTVQKSGLAQPTITTPSVDENNRLDKPVSIHWSCRDPELTKQKVSQLLLDAISDGLSQAYAQTRP